MWAECCVCGELIELPDDELLKVDQEIDDELCDNCSKALLEFMKEWALRLN